MFPIDILSDAEKHPAIKKLDSTGRLWILQQLHLRHKSKEKFPTPQSWLWTPENLEQATRESIARYKASKIPQVSEIWDLCCGGGADSLFLPVQKVYGVDTNLESLQYFTFNHKSLGHIPLPLCMQVQNLRGKFPLGLIDPARRKEGGASHWQGHHFSPSIEQLKELAPKFNNLVFKWAPGVPSPFGYEDCQTEWIGEGDNCLEKVLWKGEAWTPGLVQSTNVKTGESVQEKYSELKKYSLDIRAPGQYLLEPLKMLIPSGLFVLLGAKAGYWKIDPSTALLSSDQIIPNHWFKTYRVLEVKQEHPKNLNRWLKKSGLWGLPIKTRGWSHPDLNGNTTGKGNWDRQLLLGWIGQTKTAFLVEPVSN